MATNLHFSPDQRRTLDRAVIRLYAQTGSLRVTYPDAPFESLVLAAGESKDFDETAGLTLYSPRGARVAITYWDDVPVPNAKSNRSASK